MTVGDFITTTVEKANDKNEAIHNFFARQKFTYEKEKEISIACEEIVKSAFQEWERGERSKIVNGLNDTALRKQGWNGMNDRIVNDPQICLTPDEVEKIKQLREP